jgi:hydrogenase maturation protease
MATKVFFIGNPLGGDDGIGPYLFKELERHPRLEKYEMMELGVIGLDLVSYVDDDDTLIIVDAIHSEKNLGKVVILDETDLKSGPALISQHDFGVEETAKVLRRFKPRLKAIKIVGINVNSTKAFTNKLSGDIMKKMPRIKEDVINKVIEAAK